MAALVYVTANDRMINPELERTLAKKRKATTLEVPTSQPRGDADATGKNCFCHY